jgi:hypothetical protein
LKQKGGFTIRMPHEQRIHGTSPLNDFLKKMDKELQQHQQTQNTNIHAPYTSLSSDTSSLLPLGRQ